jgi:hypothetical protein
MTYFYKVAGTIARKVGGEPPASEYVAIDPKGIIRHIKNGQIIEERPLDFPENESQYSSSELKELKELYNDAMGSKIARGMLISYRKKKTMKPKPVRKIKVVKKCTCK